MDEADSGRQATDKARILLEALPYMQHYASKVVVIKYGGHAMDDGEALGNFARDVVLIKQSGMRPVVVHGGGPQIGKLLDRLGIRSRFLDGLRITDRDTVDVVEMVLAGSINKSIVVAINQVGGLGVGICGKDGRLASAKKLRPGAKSKGGAVEACVDLGYVGEVEAIHPQLVTLLMETEAIPVIAPLGVSSEGETLNINADSFAAALAVALGAERLLLLTDVRGVLDGEKRLLRFLREQDAEALIASGVICGGMIPKVREALKAIAQGVGGVAILDGRTPHATIVELLSGMGEGTLISNKHDALADLP